MTIHVPDDFIDYVVNMMADEEYDCDHDRWVEYAHLERNGFDVLVYPYTLHALQEAIDRYNEVAPDWRSLPENAELAALGRKLTDRRRAISGPLTFKDGEVVPSKIEVPEFTAQEVETLRAIELKLRDRARSEAGLPLLTEVEKSNWVYDRKEFLERKSMVLGVPFKEKDRKKYSNEIANYIINHYPEAIRYLKSVREYGKTLPPDIRVGVDEGRKILSCIFFYCYLDDATARVLGEEGPESTIYLYAEEIIEDKITRGEI